jgi:hypothetical protein
MLKGPRFNVPVEGLGILAHMYGENIELTFCHSESEIDCAVKNELLIEILCSNVITTF